MSMGLGRREPCVACSEPVFLAERLLVERRLYHRTCFTCARCGAQLSLASCYQTETDGQYCCETCPDEETYSLEDDDASSDRTDSIKTGDTHTSKSEDRKLGLLSDEEKVRNVQQFKDALAAEDSAFNRSLRQHSVKSTTSSKALSGFLNAQFQQNSDEDYAPALPSTLPPMMPPENKLRVSKTESISMDLDVSSPAEESINKLYPVNKSDNVLSFDSESRPSVSVGEAAVSADLKHFNDKTKSGSGVDDTPLVLSPSNDKVVHKLEAVSASSSEDVTKLQSKIDNGSVEKEFKKVDVSSEDLRLRNVNIEEVHVNQLITASDSKEDDSNLNNARDYVHIRAEIDDLIAKENQRIIKPDTFDKKDTEREVSQETSSPSLVKMRMKQFEAVSPDKNRLSEDKFSPIDSRKSFVDQNKLVLTKDKFSLSDNISNHSSDSSFKGSTKSITNDVEYTPVCSISEVLPNNLNVESGLEESRTLEINVPCIENSTPFTDSTKSNDIISEKNALQEPVEAEANVVELKEEKHVLNTDKLNEMSEDVNYSTTNKMEHDDKEAESNVIDGSKENVEENFVDNVGNTEIVNLKNNDIDDMVSEMSKTEMIKNQTSKNENYPVDLNPFGTDEEDESEQVLGTSDKVIKATDHSLLCHTESSPAKEKISTNPFGSCSEDEDEESATKVVVKKKSSEKPPRPPPPAILINSTAQNNLPETRKIISSPNLNPFDSDDDEVCEGVEQTETPVPTPRQRVGDSQEPQPAPRSSLGSAGPASFHGSTSSLSSTISRRKKAPAPKPPASGVFDSPIAAPRANNLHADDHDVSIGSTISSPNSSLFTVSPQLSPRSRKRRQAPAPPAASSTFINSSMEHHQSFNSTESPSLRLLAIADDEFLVPCSPIGAGEEKSMTSITSRRIISAVEFDEPDPEMSPKAHWSDDVINKEDHNKTSENVDKKATPSPLENKSTSGVWKRRKGPAPAVPLLQRRVPAQPLSAAAIRRELNLLEEQQRGLEKQGVRLEEIIRERGETRPEGTPDPETDELVLQLFELVNEKNELFRRQAELMYIRRQQRLEEEHADLEHQLRCMMARPEANKTDADKAREEQLLQRLLHVVARRDEVVAALEDERLRERREDQAIRERMALHRAKLDENSSLSSAESQTSTKKEKKKDKKRWMKRDKQKKPEDKNISEEPNNEMNKKEKKAKRWF